MKTIGDQWVFAQSLVMERIYFLEKCMIRKVGVVSDVCDHYGPAVIIRWPDQNTSTVGVGFLKKYTRRSRSGYFYKHTQEEPQAR